MLSSALSFEQINACSLLSYRFADIAGLLLSGLRSLGILNIEIWI